MSAVIQFTDSDIEKSSGSDTPFCFSGSMISTCAPVFDSCESNYDVEDKLRAAGVITPALETDTESCSLYVYFKTRRSAASFIRRFNKYLAAQAGS